MGVRLSLLNEWDGLVRLFDGIISAWSVGGNEFSSALTSFREEVLEYIVCADRSSCGSRVGFIREYLEGLINALRGSGFGVLVVDAVLSYRGLVRDVEGLGPLWFTPLWHPLLDVPWIPSSSIKGVLRNSYEWLLAESWGVDVSDRGVRSCSSILFGCSESDCPGGVEPGVGLVKVLDAYPVGCGLSGGLVEADVVTRHYGENTVTELDVKPIPVHGLVIAAGTKYEFIILLEEAGEEALRVLRENNCIPQALANNNSPGILGLVSRLLFYALENVGVGGRTTRGYGFFNQIERIEYIQSRRSRRR